MLFNRKLWTVFLSSLSKDDDRLPAGIRKNLLRLGVYIMGETFSLMTAPKPDHLELIIKINRGLAAGLRGKS